MIAGPTKTKGAAFNVNILSNQRAALLDMATQLLNASSQGFVEAVDAGVPVSAAVKVNLPLVTGEDRHAVGVYVRIYEIYDQESGAALQTGVYVGSSFSLPVRLIQHDSATMGYLSGKNQRNNNNKAIRAFAQAGKVPGMAFGIFSFKLMELPNYN